ncbi:translation initiation factor eIF-2B subunit delta isoform X2 [Orussus abietinus]|uniref:translation initiation factor eIF-2B subunit delta isoform X2 n=1 Tax=Orussus abietinus TaxID=222816 RepID=UPI00062521F5|nr:translation initiation factor eIF-2B subunit delta isoform X2 [Orussus abietinus]
MHIEIESNSSSHLSLNHMDTAHVCGRLIVDKVTMEQQSTTSSKTKITRSEARHLRRKRLIIARKEAEKNLSNVEDSIVVTNKDDDKETTVGILTKSKAKRLRKKNKLLHSNETSKDEIVLPECTKHLSSIGWSVNVLDSNEQYGENFCDVQFNPVTNLNGSPQLYKNDRTCNWNIGSASALNLERNLSIDQTFSTFEDTCFAELEDAFSSELELCIASNNKKKIGKPLSTSNPFQHDAFVNDDPQINIDFRSGELTSDENKEHLNRRGKQEKRKRQALQDKKGARAVIELNEGKQAQNSHYISRNEFIENQKNLENSDRTNVLTVSSSENEPSRDDIDSGTNLRTDLAFNVNTVLPSFINKEKSVIDLISASMNEIVLPQSSLPRNLSESKEAATTSQVTSDNSMLLTNTTQKETISISDILPEVNLKPASNDSNLLNNPVKSSEVIMIPQEKTKEQVKAEREAKKAAKAALKSKVKGTAIKPQSAEGCEKETVTLTTNADIPVSIKKEMGTDVIEAEIVPAVKLISLGVTKKISIENSQVDASDVPETKGVTKSKAELRAERRAKQEAQRAAKQESVISKSKKKTTDDTKVPTTPVKDNDSVKKIVKKSVISENPHEVNLFKHLYQKQELSLHNLPSLNTSIHPAIIRLGVQYASRIIVGSNARCVALLAAVKQLIEDFERPSQADFTRGLEASLKECVTYLQSCRPLAVSMQNALKHLKRQMTQLPTTISDHDAKNTLRNAIDTYIVEQIQLADKAISESIQTKISNGDVILTYGYSSLIQKILCDAHTAGRQFRVVIVDGRPWLEGKELLRRLAKHGMECSYVLINALSFIMHEVSKVFLGAHAILANGAVMSRVGTAQVALMAKAFNVPVLVACETHKSCERVQTESIVYNEIGNADELTRDLLCSSKKGVLSNWRAKKSLNLLNITYDVTPADLVTAVVTELAILPCTSVPVILRIKPSEI